MELLRNTCVAVPAVYHVDTGPGTLRQPEREPGGVPGMLREYWEFLGYLPPSHRMADGVGLELGEGGFMLYMPC